MPHLSRRTNVVLIALFVLAVLAWMLHCPERPDRVYRAMPANSVLVSEHRDLAGVWRERFDNPLLVNTLAACGVDAADLAADTNAVWIVRLVSGRQSLIGWSPALGPTAQPAWTGASWVGLRGRLFQLMLLARWIPGAGRLETTRAGVRYLPLKSRKQREKGMKLAFAVRENVLLATLGTDPDAVRVLDWRLHHDVDPAPLFGTGTQPWRSRHATPHRAWVDPAASPVALPLSAPVEVQVESITDRRLALTLQAPWPAAWPQQPAPLAGRCTAADALASGPSRALLLLSDDAAQRLLGPAVPAFNWSVGAGAAPREDACVYLTTKPCEGRLFNLAVPALTLSLPWSDPPASDLAPRLAAAVGARLNVLLLTRPPQPPVEGRTLVDIGRRGKRGGLLSDADCLAIEQRPGWLTCSSSARSLDAQRRVSPDPAPAWRTGLETAMRRPGVCGYLWADAPGLAHEARQVVAVYRLATALGLLRVTDEEDARAKRIIAGLVALESLGTVQMSWFGTDGRMGMSVEIANAETGGAPTVNAGEKGTDAPAQWYCVISGQRLGPMSRHDLQALAQMGRLRAEDWVWEAAFGDQWRPARTVAGLLAGGPPPLGERVSPPGAAVLPDSPTAGAPPAPVLAPRIEKPGTPVWGVEGREPSAREAAARSWARMRRILFTPFDLARWFSIGFCAWLATVGSGSGRAFNRIDPQTLKTDVEAGASPIEGVMTQMRAFFEAHPTLSAGLLALGLAMVLMMAATAVLFCWLRARGTFMFLHRVHRPSATVREAWQVAGETSGALFRWRLGFGIVITVLMLAIVVGGALTLGVSDMHGASWDLLAAAVTPLWLACCLGALFVVLVVWLTGAALLADFVEPVMYWRKVDAWTAWRTVGDLCRQQPQALTRYYLLLMVWWILAALAIVIGVLLTCCLGCVLLVLPVVGAVATLPVFVFFRSLGMQFLLQWRHDLMPGGLEET